MKIFFIRFLRNNSKGHVKIKFDMIIDFKYNKSIIKLLKKMLFYSSLFDSDWFA